MKLEQALKEYGEVVVINGNANDLEQVGYCYPLTATTMAFEVTENYLASQDIEVIKKHHRMARKEKRKAKAKRKAFKAGSFLTNEQKSFGKRTLHRFNRRNWEVPYHKVKGNFGQILWDMT